MTTLNLTGEMEKLIGDIVLRAPELSHIEPSRVLVCVASTRGGGVHGTYAKIHPLRFPGGERTMETRRGLKKVVYSMPDVTYRGIDILYVIYFLVPRFLNLPLREKLITIFHELYHISPEFDGDIRRFPGKNYAHGSSRKRYNALMASLVEDYLGKLEDAGLVDFLEGDMAAIRARHRVMVGRKFPAPRLKRISG
ncbi:MAG TPA: putative metallopeptidase [Geobacteraceae bacterium]|jgi:predicted metallopeptidase|nr:putative metallopeptidase [Geobacteraceae bacterium]